MKARFYQSATYVAPGVAEAGREGRQKEWDEYQRQQRAQRVTMSNITDDPTVSRKRADSHQPASTPPQARQTINSSHAEYRQSPTTSTHSISSSNPDGPRSYSRTDYEYAGTTLLPQLSPMSPYSEVRKLSGNWNAPTHVELERTRQHRKSLSSVEKLRNRVKGWVRA